MLLAAITTLRVEDFPTQREWIGKLLFPINQFLLSATSTINGNVTLGDNIPCQTQALNFTFGGVGDFPKNFKWSVAVAPTEMRICSISEGGVPIAAVLSWSYASGNVSITDIIKITENGASGLVAGKTYNVVLRGQP